MGTLDLTYPPVLSLLKEHLDPKRTESASFLIWYLQNYYHLDPLDAVDCVCDQKGDKGVDGIYVSDSDSSIDIFACRISQVNGRTVGDTALKEFYGTLSQFKDEASIQNLIVTAGQAHVVGLVKRLDLISKVTSHEIRGVFLSNMNIDANGLAFLNTVSNLTFVGKDQLVQEYISDQRTTPIKGPVEFDISGFPVSEYFVSSKVKATIAPVKAKELVKLQGIVDQSLFAFNVRGPLGRTQVNKDIQVSIKDPGMHKLFPLFHNGITIICSSAKVSTDKIVIEKYYVVNGCQSIDCLYRSQSSLTDDLRILTKFVQIDEDNVGLAEKVTWYSNNQNSVKARDFMANNPIQIRLQNEFDKYYGGTYAYEIKRGENPKAGETISNEDAGLYLMSFDLKQPWATHRKYQVFEEKHAELFARPEVSADRIVMCHVMMQSIIGASGKINNKLFAKYVLTRFLMLYTLRCILEQDSEGKRLIADPALYVRDENNRAALRSCIDRIVNEFTTDVNAEVDPHGDDFDYRGKLRDAEWAAKLSKEIVTTHLKLVARGRIEGFESDWKAKIAVP